MAIRTYQCERCNHTFEKLVRKQDEAAGRPACPACIHGYANEILSVPSPMQWGCRKGF